MSFLKYVESLTLLLVVLPAVVYSVPWLPEPRNDPNWLAQHDSHVVQTINNNNSIKAIFMGASITDWYPDNLFNENFARFGAVNYGISGDGVEHAFWRMTNGRLDLLNPNLKLIVFSDCGSNSAGQYNAEEIARGYNSALEWIKQNLPFTRVLLMGLMPRDNGNIDRWIRLTDVNIRNSKQGERDANKVIYLDLWNQFSQTWGVVEPNLFLDDQLNLTQQGYERWTEIINPLFQDLINRS